MMQCLTDWEAFCRKQFGRVYEKGAEFLRHILTLIQWPAGISSGRIRYRNP